MYFEYTPRDGIIKEVFEELNIKKQNKMKLSVVIPAYNEEKRIPATLHAIDTYLKKQEFEYQIIVVVNGSHDQTYEVVRELAAKEIANLTAVNLAKGGKGYAVKKGILEYADGDVIMFMDADNATPISEVSKFFQYFEKGFDIVIGSRYLDPDKVKVHQPFYRILLSRASNLLIQIMAAPGIKDTQVGFKAFNKKAAKDIFRFVTISRWGFDFEVLKIGFDRGYKIKEVALSWTEHGGGHVPLKAYLESLVDLFKIKFRSLRGDYTKALREN